MVLPLVKISMNIFGTENVVNASLALKIEKLIYISSIATLGNSNSNLITEDDFYDLELLWYNG